jgi:cystathionine beta-lyase family protein involved in aluminum resistance
VRVETAPLRGVDADPDAIAHLCRSLHPALVFVQRSRGYSARRTLSVDGFGALAARIREAAPSALILVDECYCELVEERGALHAGADAIIGSLIKNVGGALAPTGAYVIGTREVIERVAARVYAPGLGAALGPTLGLGRLFLQGLFGAPRVITETLRGLDFFAALFAHLGFDVDPRPGGPRADIIQAIRLGNRPRVEAFAAGLQLMLPVNARFRPQAGAVPGYRDSVIMSSGSFVSGATIELSCDAPLREPYDMFVQGGVAAEHAVWGALGAARMLDAEGLL